MRMGRGGKGGGKGGGNKVAKSVGAAVIADGVKQMHWGMAAILRRNHAVYRSEQLMRGK